MDLLTESTTENNQVATLNSSEDNTTTLSVNNNNNMESQPSPSTNNTIQEAVQPPSSTTNQSSDYNTSSPNTDNITSKENQDPTRSIPAESQKQLLRSSSINRPRKALPRPGHHVPSHSSIDFSFESSNIHQLEKNPHFVVDHNSSPTNTPPPLLTSTTMNGDDALLSSSVVQITTTTDSPTATTTTLVSSSSGHHLTSHSSTTTTTTAQQRRMSHKRSSSDVSGLFGNSTFVAGTTISPATPNYGDKHSTTADSSASRKKFTLFGFSFGGGKSSSNLHSMAPNIPSNASTPTLTSSPITSSSSNTLPTTPIANRSLSSSNDQSSTTSSTTTTNDTITTTTTSEDHSSSEIMRRNRGSDDVSHQVLNYLNDKPPNRVDDETMKKRQGMHMDQPIGSLNLPEDGKARDRGSRREIDLINFLGEMNLNACDDLNSTGGRSGIDERVLTSSESREQTTYGFKSFLDKVRNKAIFARGANSPADEAYSSTTISELKAEEDAKSDNTTISTKTPKKLSEKELRKIKLMERETFQKEMMDGILDKISRNGESFAHLTFYDENDQEWQYIGYIQKYDSSMTDDELYMMYALLGVGGAEEGTTPKNKEKDVKDFTGGIYGDACVCPVLSRLCGRGELRYPNGSIYEGDIIRGKRHGFGKMIFPYKSTLPPTKKSGNITEQAPPTAIAIGQWVLNNPSEAIPFKVTYSNELEYWGTFKAKAKFMSAYVISVGDLEKHKEGELYHVQENKKYFGGFSEDLKDGYGVEVMGNGERYYGGWKNGLYHHMGTYQYIDGSYFQGEFKRGCRKGKGKLYFATGDVIEGIWNGDKIESAVFKKGNCKNVELTHLFQLRTQVNDAIKLFQNVGHMDDSNYIQFLRMTKKESIERPELELKWKYYSLMSKENWRKEKTQLLEYYSKNGDKCNLLDKVVFKNEVIKLLGETVKTDYVSPQAGFVKGFIEFFDGLYHGSYYAGNNRNQSSGARKVARKDGVLLYNAIDDLKSFIIFLCDQVVWEFFGNEIISAKLGTTTSLDTKMEEQDGQCDDYDDEIIFGNAVPIVDITKSHFTTAQQAYSFCKTIIADHLHKKLYSTTFELYEYHFRDQDLMINQKINSILTACSLQNFGVHSEFIPKDLSVKPYGECIQLMKEIKFSNSVESKIRVLSKLRTLVMQSMKKVKLENKNLKKRLSGDFDYENVESDDWQPGADDVTSLYTYSFIKTNIGNYTALFNYVNDWKSPHTSLKPVSHVISFFEGFLAYIMDLDPNLTVKQSELGESMGDGAEDSYVYISKYGLTKQLERAIELAIFRNQSSKEKIERQMQKPNLDPEELKDLMQQQKELQLISFSWVSPLLLFVSLQVGHIQLQVNKKAEATQNSVSSKALSIEVVETTHQNMIVPMVDGSGNMLNLAQALMKYHSLVQSVLESARLGFNIALKSDKKEEGQSTTTDEKVSKERIVIEFDKEPFPSYVYSELSLEIAKFIKFELENSDHQYHI